MVPLGEYRSREMEMEAKLSVVLLGAVGILGVIVGYAIHRAAEILFGAVAGRLKTALANRRDTL